MSKYGVEILTTPLLAEELARAGRKHVEDAFSEGAMIDRYEKFYEQT